MTQALYRKWRPRRWDSVVGQEHVIQTLRNAVASERVAHAYLFAGPRGTGKTTTARLLAKAVNCLDPDPAVRPCDRCDHCLSLNAGRFLDLIEIDAASNTSVDDVRDLRDKINFSPNQGRYKVYVVDEVHMLSTAAFNALLKTLEEPPAHAIFVLATTEPHKIPATVLSRCQRHEFRRIPLVDIVSHLEEIARDEGLEAAPEALALIARQSTGSMRDAISLVDQLASSGQEITLEMAQAVLGTATSQSVIDVVQAILDKDSGVGLDYIHRALDSGSDPRQFARQIVEYLRDLLLIKMGNASQIDATAEARATMAGQTDSFTTAGLLGMIRAFNHAATDARGTWQPALPLEMAFVEALSPETEPEKASGPILAAAPAVKQGGKPPQPATQPTVQAKRVTSEAEPEESPANQALAHNWENILSQVRERNPNTYGLLNSCKLRHMKNNVLILGFASELLKNQMLKKENLEIVESTLAQVMEKEIAVRCVISNASGTSLPDEVDNDGMVAAALRDLGGEIVDIQ